MRRVLFLLAVAAAAGSLDLPSALAAGPKNPTFTISVEKEAWGKWGFQYPVTYVFEVSGLAGGLAGGLAAHPQVNRRDAPSGPWTPLEKRTSADFFNGIECVRIDPGTGKAYVSVGFKTSNAIELEFAGAASVKFESIARYYDGRKSAYTLSNDNWGCNPWAHPAAPWRGPTDDASDNYQAALHVCRSFHLPLSIAINSRSAGGEAVWRVMQEELDRKDFSWEPAVHGRTHPKDAPAYAVHGYRQEILGCREDILKHLHNIPYGQHVFEHILTHGYVDDTILSTDAGEFLFLRGFNWLDNPTSTGYAPWSAKFRLYGVAGLNTKGYDTMLEQREPKGRFFAKDVAELNAAFDQVHESGGIFYALWHPDRFRNSVLYDPSPGVDGVHGSTLMQHLAHVANRKDVWYVANGWLYSYRYVAQNARVAGGPP